MLLNLLRSRCGRWSPSEAMGWSASKPRQRTLRQATSRRGSGPAGGWTGGTGERQDKTLGRPERPRTALAAREDARRRALHFPPPCARPAGLGARLKPRLHSPSHPPRSPMPSTQPTRWDHCSAPGRARNARPRARRWDGARQNRAKEPFATQPAHEASGLPGDGRAAGVRPSRFAKGHRRRRRRVTLQQNERTVVGRGVGGRRPERAGAFFV